MTSPRETPAGRENRQPAPVPELDVDWRQEERERRAIDDLLPDYGWLRRSEYVITVEQSSDVPGPPSLNDLLRSIAARSRDPEPDLEAEP